MKVVVLEHADQAAQRVSAEILEALRNKPDLVLGLATGSTPIGVYARLIQAHQVERTDFSRVTTFNLDEYLDLAPDHPQSYRYFMHKYLFSGLNIHPSRIHFPPTQGPDLPEKCTRYEERI